MSYQTYPCDGHLLEATLENWRRLGGLLPKDLGKAYLDERQHAAIQNPGELGDYHLMKPFLLDALLSRIGNGDAWPVKVGGQVFDAEIVYFYPDSVELGDDLEFEKYYFYFIEKDIYEKKLLPGWQELKDAGALPTYSKWIAGG